MDESLVARRPKRSTAGNRMEAALAEFKAEELGQDVEEDADFAIDKDEEDVFESDFESTDEEGAQEDVDAAAEKLIRQEESRVRKTARTHLERITALAHSRQAATFNPSAIVPPSQDKEKAKKLKRRVSLGVAVNAETGEVLEENAESTDGTMPAPSVMGGRRHSMRAHTIANTAAAVNRVRDEVRKQSSAPKRVKTVIKAPTQTELIKRALDMEAGNIAEHKNYLTLEEEKRKKARVVRTSVQGPLIRWVSKKEEVTVLVQPPAPTVSSTPSRAPSGPGPSASAYTPYRYPSKTAATSPTVSHPTPYSHNPAQNSYPPAHLARQYSPVQYSPQYASPVPPSPSSATPQSPTPFQQWPPPPTRPLYFHPSSSQASPPGTGPSISPAFPGPFSSHTPSTGSVMPQASSTMMSPSSPIYTAPLTMPPMPVPPPLPPARPIERKETVAKQYVVHELGQTDKAPRPTWKSTMTAMFGDHADWENARVYLAKGRPLARPTQMCPITGKVAKYLDPRTNVPYADLEAYRVLSAVMRHEYVWSPVLECYVLSEANM